MLWKTFTEYILNSLEDVGSPEAWSRPAMSNDGLIALAVSLGSFADLLAFHSDGGLAWIARLPFPSPGDPIFDSAGQLYVPGMGSVDGGYVWALWSATSEGSVVFIDYFTGPFGSLAAGPGFVSISGFGALRPDGGSLYQLAFDGGDYFGELCEDKNNQIVDQGSVVIGSPALEYGALAPDGGILWSEGFNPTGGGSVLSDDGTIFRAFSDFLTCTPATETATISPPALGLEALSAASGKSLWAISYLMDSGVDTQLPGGAPQGLALTPSGTLLLSDGVQVLAIFAGQERPSTTAYWSHDRGSNDNRACPSPP